MENIKRFHEIFTYEKNEFFFSSAGNAPNLLLKWMDVIK